METTLQAEGQHSRYGWHRNAGARREKACVNFGAHQCAHGSCSLLTLISMLPFSRLAAPSGWNLSIAPVPQAVTSQHHKARSAGSFVG